ILIKWPDMFYHTSMDTLDKVDQKSLKIIGITATTYAYFLANATKREAQWLAYELASQFRRHVIKLGQDTLTRVLEAPKDTNKILNLTEQQLNLLLEQKKQALVKIAQLGDISPIFSKLSVMMEDTVKKEIAQMKMNLGKQIEKPVLPKLTKWDKIAQTMIPKRNYRGPINLRGYSHKLSKEDRDKLYQFRSKYKTQFPVLTAIAEYWADGKMSLFEIINRVEIETQIRASELVVEYFQILKRLKLVDIIKQSLRQQILD
ncbi:MAG: hypothetical protein ABIK67_07290, partial [candidate division WOR-3 bacterium]